jgi:hypothetical protein
MGSAFAADFSGVSIHTDEKAAQMSKDLHAQAFTYGNDIYFNSGKYNTDTSAGKHLLAHELTHVVQQGHAGRADFHRKPGRVIQGKSPEREPDNTSQALPVQRLQHAENLPAVPRNSVLHFPQILLPGPPELHLHRYCFQVLPQSQSQGSIFMEPVSFRGRLTPGSDRKIWHRFHDFTDYGRYHSLPYGRT